jgi:hypothetical protein
MFRSMDTLLSAYTCYLSTTRTATNGTRAIHVEMDRAYTTNRMERIEGGQRVADLYLCENALRTYGEDEATLVRASGTTAAVAGGIALDAGVQEMDGIDRVVASAE